MKKQDNYWKRLVNKLAKHYNFPVEFFQSHVLNATFETGIDDLDGFLELWVQNLPILEKNHPQSVKLAFRYDCGAMIGRYRNGNSISNPNWKLKQTTQGIVLTSCI